jgi:hypothetical protein
MVTPEMTRRAPRRREKVIASPRMRKARSKALMGTKLMNWPALEGPIA